MCSFQPTVGFVDSQVVHFLPVYRDFQDRDDHVMRSQTWILQIGQFKWEGQGRVSHLF
jgi:hypothetical protein